MKRTIEITINGNRYPCRVLLGGYLRFRDLTGKEATSIDTQSISDLATLLYSFVAASCNSSGIPFDLSLYDFCDSLEMEELERFLTLYNSEAETGSEDASDADKKKAAP